MHQDNRIYSVDALRGFVMLMIIGTDQFFYQLDEVSDHPIANFLGTQFDHPEWYGWHFYDIIMPLFLFIVGVVIPVAIRRRIEAGTSYSDIYKHILWRVLLLWILGMIAQGHLLAFDPHNVQFFSNTLQAIAVGYLFTSIAYLHLERKGRIVLFFSCLILYAILLAFPHVPGYGQSRLIPDGNFAIYIDRLLLGPFDDGTQYTWIITGLGFTATVLSGSFAGEILLSKKLLPSDKMKYLLIGGLLALAAGLIWGIWHPIVKKLWSSSMVLFNAGLCTLLLVLFYWIIDVKGYRKWSFFLVVIGMNAIFAYMLVHVVNMSTVADQILFGFEQWLGQYYVPFTYLAGTVLVYLILLYMYRKGTFIKI